jgi:hypothetical protein
MLKFVILFFVIILFFGCSSKTDSQPKEILLKSGKKVEISIERKHLLDQPKSIIVEISTDQKLVKETELEKDVLDIWSEIGKNADEEEIEEAILKYRYLVEDLNEKGELESVFVISIFSAEKIENGKWKIDKIG